VSFIVRTGDLEGLDEAEWLTIEELHEKLRKQHKKARKQRDAHKWN
jgi:hypothetical protein